MVPMVLMGCQGNKNDGSSQQGTENEAKHNNGAEYSSDIAIEWLLSDWVVIPQKNIDMVNDILAEKGCKYTLNVQYASDEEYKGTLESKLTDGSIDIAWTGMMTNGYSIPKQIIEEGLFENLTPYFEDGYGKTLREFIPDGYWASATSGGDNYYVPNTYFGPSLQLYVEFNPEYFTDSEISDFDGSFEMLKQMQEEKGGVVYMDDMDMIYISSYTGCTYNDGEMASNTDLKADIKYLDNLYAPLKTLNSMYENNVLIKVDDKADCDSCIAWIKYGRIENADFDGVYSYGTDTVFSLSTAGEAISINSRNKDAAVEMLTYLMTDTDVANALIYGCDAESVSEEMYSDAWMRIMLTGCFAAIDDTEYDDVPGSHYDEVVEKGERLKDSPMLGFYFNPEGCEEYEKVLNIDMYERPDFTVADFDNRWASYIEKLKNAGIEKYYEEFNRQLEEFLNTK